MKLASLLLVTINAFPTIDKDENSLQECFVGKDDISNYFKENKEDPDIKENFLIIKKTLNGKTKEGRRNRKGFKPRMYFSKLSETLSDPRGPYEKILNDIKEVFETKKDNYRALHGFLMDVHEVKYIHVCKELRGKLSEIKGHHQLPEYDVCKNGLLNCLSTSMQAYTTIRKSKPKNCEDTINSTHDNSDIFNIIVEHCKAIGN